MARGATLILIGSIMFALQQSAAPTQDSPQRLAAKLEALAVPQDWQDAEARFQLAARLGLYDQAGSALDFLDELSKQSTSAGWIQRKPVWEAWRLWLLARPPAVPSLGVFDGIGSWKLRFAAGYPEEAASLERLAQDMLLERRHLRQLDAARHKSVRISGLSLIFFLGMSLVLAVVGRFIR